MDYDVRFIPPQADDSNVTTFPNRGNNALNLISTGALDQIKYRTAVSDAGGNPVLRIANNALLNIASYDPTDYGYSSIATYVVGLKDSKGSGTNRLVFGWFQSSSNLMALWAQYSDDKMYADFGNETTGRVSGSVSTVSTPVVLSGIHNGSTFTGYRGGTTVLSGSSTASISSASPAFTFATATTTENGIVGDIYAFAHAPISNEPLRRRMEQSVGYSFKIATG